MDISEGSKKGGREEENELSLGFSDPRDHALEGKFCGHLEVSMGTEDLCTPAVSYRETHPWPQPSLQFSDLCI